MATHSRNVYDLDLKKKSRLNVNIPIESSYMTSYMMAIMFARFHISRIYA